MKLESHFVDITNLKIDCIVNSARTSFLGGGGIYDSIHRKAGKGLGDYCQILGKCKMMKQSYVISLFFKYIDR